MLITFAGLPFLNLITPLRDTINSFHALFGRHINLPTSRAESTGRVAVLDFAPLEEDILPL